MRIHLPFRFSGKFFPLTLSLFFISFLLGLHLSILAQSPSTTDKYYFTTGDDGSLALDMYGNAVNMSSGTTQLIGSNQSSSRSNATNIGFTFSFLNANFTQFSVNANAGIRLGSTRINTGDEGSDFPISSGSYISPYWGNLKTSSSGKIHYKTQGSSGKRILIIEFLNMGINTNSSGANGTFQCRLYEETGVIEYVYGKMEVGSNSGNSDSKIAVIGFSNNTRSNRHFSVNQSTYAYSTTSRIRNTNSSTGTISGLNGTTNGSQRWFRFYPYAFRSNIISISYGSNNWCAGEARDVTVRIQNTGTHAWTDDGGAGRDINIGLKWNVDSDYGSGPSFISRLDADGLAPGDTKDYVFLNVVPPTGTGSENLRSDVVYEAVSWFSGNNSFVGPGNSSFLTPTITRRAAATAVTASGAGTFCNNTTISASGGGGGSTIYFQGTTSDGTSISDPGSSKVVTNSGTYYFRARTNSYGCWGAEDAVTVTINPNIPVSASISSDISSACSGTVINFSSTPTNEGATPAYQWYVNNVAVTDSIYPTFSPTNLNNNDQVKVVLTSSVTPCATNNPATSNIIPVSIGAIPATPGPISGITDACPYTDTNNPVSYSIASIPGAVTYTWTIPPVGVSIVSGQGTNNLSVTYDNTLPLTHNRFYVTATNSFPCTSDMAELEVLKIIPAIPASISGPTDVCPYVGQPTTATYSIAAVPNATGYTWTAPPNANIVSGQGTTSVDIEFYSNFTSGSIKVSADANCGSRAPRSLSVRKVPAAAPVAISGPTNACPYLDNVTQVTYSITPVANATSYDWVLPNNMNLVNGQGTSSITVTFSTNYTTGQLRVRSVTACNTSGYRNLIVSNATYGAPGAISGTTNACSLIGQPVTTFYTIYQVANAPSYNWVVPTGVNIVSHPGGAGVNDTIIEVEFNSSFVSGTAIKVQTTGCITSSFSSLNIYSSSIPGAPGLMNGYTNVCEYMISPTNITGTIVEYKVPKRSDAVSYNWTAPANATIVNHPEGPGVNDTIVEVIFDDDFVSGMMEVTASNGCNSSAARTLKITTLKPGAPGGITATPTVPCPGREFTYSISTMPNNATSLYWEVPVGGSIQNGQGSTSITVLYHDQTVNGVVSVTAMNNCSQSSTRNLTVKLPDCSGPKTFVNTQTIGAEEMDMVIFPNPSSHDFNIRLNSAEPGKIQVRILDITGREVSKVSAAEFTTIKAGAKLRPGTYFVEVFQNGKRSIQKVVKY
ncbi:MAG: T9SS type A sorting domain-containing protein [Ferruginibacter sp.]|nr:T9SS type A sorting domain-containing protein [Ferruginibacter sp.]